MHALQNTKAEFVLVDAYGKIVFKQSKQLAKGYNSVSFTGLGAVPQGAYFLRINFDETVKVIPLIKASHYKF